MKINSSEEKWTIWINNSLIKWISIDNSLQIGNSMESSAKDKYSNDLKLYNIKFKLRNSILVILNVSLFYQLLNIVKTDL